jgi:hypothetical protein
MWSQKPRKGPYVPLENLQENNWMKVTNNVICQVLCLQINTEESKRIILGGWVGSSIVKICLWLVLLQLSRVFVSRSWRCCSSGLWRRRLVDRYLRFGKKHIVFIFLPEDVGYVPPKRRYVLTSPRGVTTKKINIDRFTQCEPENYAFHPQ